jgi:hypothetical protein
MAPKIYATPSAYGPDNEAVRRKAEKAGIELINIKGIAEWLGVQPNTVSRGWIADRDLVKDPEKKFPEPTWPEFNLYDKSVVRKWAAATDRLPESEK